MGERESERERRKGEGRGRGEKEREEGEGEGEREGRSEREEGEGERVREKRKSVGGTYLIICCSGGIGGLVLAIFHKFETMEKAKKLRECCPLLQRKEAEVRKNPISL